MEKLNSFRNLKIDLAEEESVKEVLEAQAHIWNHLFSFIKSVSLKCAIQLGIFETIHKSNGGPVSLSKLASESAVSQSKSQCLHRLMRILAHTGFVKLENDGYVLTKSSKLLLADSPFNMAPYLMVVLDPVLTMPTDSLAEWFRADDDVAAAAFGMTHGGLSFWEYGSREPEVARFFNEGMASDSRLVAGVLVERLRGVFEGVETLVDVGGGTGTVARSVAAAFPGVDCIVFELPHVVVEAEGAGGCSNLRFVGGDMFDKIPPADAVMLKCILHDWSDEDSVRILKKCKEAILMNGSKKGKVIIIDIIVENDKAGQEDDVSFETQILCDIEMMVLVNGKERNENEWAKLFKEAGFSKYSISPLGLRSLIEVYP